MFALNMTFSFLFFKQPDNYAATCSLLPRFLFKKIAS